MRRPAPTDIPDEVVRLCRQLTSAGFEAWLVGGAVRDLLLTRGQAYDFDVATSAAPDEVARVFGRRKTIPTGEKHGTVTVLLRDPNAPPDPQKVGQVEVTTYRGEGAYTDGRRPDEVTFVRSLVEDLQRRDFTMNAIAYDPLTDRLEDPFGGQTDLAAGIIRAVGDPVARFGDDGLRAMRAVRFAAQLGFAVEPATEAAIAGTLATFRRISAERVRDELLKLLAAPVPSVGLRLMERTGLLGVVLPELVESVGVHQNRHHAHDVWHHVLACVDAAALAEGSGSPWMVRMAALLHDVAKPRTAAPRADDPTENTFYRHEYVGAKMADAIARRLKLSNEERERLVLLVGHHMFWYAAEWTDGTVRRFISRVGVEALPQLFALREADVRGRGRDENPGVELDELRRRVAGELERQVALKVSDLAISGQDVMRILAVPPGRIVGQVLRALLERVLDDAALNTSEQLSALVPEVAASATETAGGAQHRGSGTDE